MAVSRLKKAIKSRTKKSILLTFVGIIALLTVLFTFGPDLLINFSAFVGKFNTKNEANNSTQDSAFIPAPVLDSLPTATNSASTKVTGYTETKNQIVKIYVNGNFSDKKRVGNDKSFAFANIKLEPGDNSIKAKIVTEDNKESDYSNEVKITYIDKMPTLTVDSPTDGTSFKNDRISISGTTDSGNNVTVNDFWAIVNDNGKFSYSGLKLQNGENSIKVVATDTAGNQTTKEIKVTFSP